jgi:hypothetical protein
VNVILFAVDLDQYRLKIRAGLSKYLPHIIQVSFPEYCLTGLRNKDQMYMQIEKTVPAVPDRI